MFSNGDYIVDLTHAVYDAAPDGRHFVMVRSLHGSSHLTVTLNRFQHLNARDSGGVAMSRER